MFELMTIFDIVVAIPLLWGAFKGFSKGVVIEIASIISLIAGIFLAVRFSDKAEVFLREYLNNNSPYLGAISFVTVVLVVIILIFILAKTLERVVKLTGMDWLNKILGGAFGCLKFALIISTITIIINSFSKEKEFFSEETRNKSYLYQPVSSLARTVIPGVNEKLETLKKRILEEPVGSNL